MPFPSDQRCPSDKFWATIYTYVWWLLTKIPFGEQYAQWLQLRHPINAYKVGMVSTFLTFLAKIFSVSELAILFVVHVLDR